MAFVCFVEDCGANLTVPGSSSGVFTSPRWPDKYDRNSGPYNCHWEIQSRPDHKILLHLQSFSIEGELECKCSFIPFDCFHVLHPIGYSFIDWFLSRPMFQVDTLSSQHDCVHASIDAVNLTCWIVQLKAVVWPQCEYGRSPKSRHSKSAAKTLKRSTSSISPMAIRWRSRKKPASNNCITRGRPLVIDRPKILVLQYIRTVILILPSRFLFDVSSHSFLMKSSFLFG